MADVVKKYAIPFLDKYPTIQEVIKGIEEKIINRFLDVRRLTPILYLLNGEKSHAINFIDETLQRMQEEKTKLLIDYKMGKCEEPLFKDLDVYIDFADKFKKYVLADEGFIENYIDENKKIPQCGYHDRYFILDNN